VLRSKKVAYSMTSPARASGIGLITVVACTDRSASLLAFTYAVNATGRTSERLDLMRAHDSMSRLEDHVESRFRGATDLSKAACLDYLGKFHLSGLRAERHAHLLR